MTAPHSHLLEGSPRLHYLEWNPDEARTIVMLHGNSANAWWWEHVASAMRPEFRILALDQRGHGDSEWARPPAYSPLDYARDLARFAEHSADGRDKPLVVGHSMGGLNVLAFAQMNPGSACGVIAIDIAISSSRGRDRYLRRLKALPMVTYPDLDTAKARFQLMPNEGEIGCGVVRQIAGKSLVRTEDGRWTLKFDRESFLGGDGLAVLDTIKAIRIPMMLVRAERSRIMTAEAMESACAANPLVRAVTIPEAHHHVILEKPEAVARVIEEFAGSLF